MIFNRRVITKFLDLVNLKNHNDNFTEIQSDLTDHEGRIAGAQSDITTHKASTAAHPAEHVTYSGGVVGAANIQEAVDFVDERLDTIIVGGSEEKDPELTDIKTPDPSYTPGRSIAAAGDVVRDMQKQFGEQLAETEKRTDGWANLTEFDAAGDGTTNDTASTNEAFAASKAVIIPRPAISYRLSKFQGVTGQTVKGFSKSRIDLFKETGVSVVPLLGLSSDSTYEDIHFNSLEEDLEWNRGDLTNKSNVILRNCKIEGFRHTSGGPNAWGLYLDKSSNITIDNCDFENNSQADIALVEGCKNITINNARGSNLHLNLEPNGPDPSIENISVRGGHYKKVELLENSVLAYSIKNFSMDSCVVENLLYRGGSASFRNTIIKKISKPFGLAIAGVVDFGGAVSFGKSLIQDTKIFNISNTGTVSDWLAGYTSTNEMYRRIDDPRDGLLFVINPDNKAGQSASISHRAALPVDENKEYTLVMTSKAKYPIGSVFVGYQVNVSYRNASDAAISNEWVIFNRAPVGGSSDLNTETAVIKPPAGCTSVRLTLSNTNTSTNSPSSLSIKSISFHEIIYTAVPDQLNEVNKVHIYNDNQKIYASEPPNALPASTTIGLKTMVLYNPNPVAGGYSTWEIITSGNPGTWKGVGAIAP